MQIELFGEIFSELENRMPQAMQANGCREQWLQTEIMMAAARHGVDIWTNTEPLYSAESKPSARAGKYDLACYLGDEREHTSAEMVAEIKIIRGDFQKKCLWGSNAQASQKLSSLYPGPDCDHWEVKAEQILPSFSKDWGLFADAARLLHHPARKRWLILVILTDFEPETPAQRLLQHALMTLSISSLDGREFRQSYDTFALRIWEL